MSKHFSASLLLSRVILLSFMFPYTEIVPLGSYTQPYGLLFGLILLLFRPGAIRALPQLDRTMLSYLAVLGLMLLLMEIPAGLDLREISFLLSYITPVISTATAYWILRRYPAMTRRMLVGGIVAWVGASFIQTFIAPSFLTQFVTGDLTLAENIHSSGRGALGLAPEPTHNAFHVMLLGAALAVAGGPIWAVALAVASGIFLAKSASMVLAIGIGILLYGARHPVRRYWIFLPIVFIPAIISVASMVSGENSRLGSILFRLKHLDPSLLLLDYSINARIAGATMPIVFTIKNFLIPQGISIQQWFDARSEILSENRWVIDLSSAGPASGIGLFVFQGGLLAVPFLLYLVYRLIVQNRPKTPAIAAATAFAIFSGQFYFSTPMFGLFLATIILRYRSETPAPVSRVQTQSAS